jgi:hypothetical protein
MRTDGEEQWDMSIPLETTASRELVDVVPPDLTVQSGRRREPGNKQRMQVEQIEIATCRGLYMQGPILNTQATHIVSYLKMRKLRPRVLR